MMQLEDNHTLFYHESQRTREFKVGGGDGRNDGYGKVLSAITITIGEDQVAVAMMTNFHLQICKHGSLTIQFVRQFK